MRDDLFNRRLEGIAPSKIKIDFNELKKLGVISLSIGEPDFETPWDIREAGIEAIQNGYTFYADDLGLPKLRQELSHYLLKHYGLHYEPTNEILVSVGASEAIDLTCRSFLNPGDEVLIPSPSYTSYSPMVTLAGGTPVDVKLDMAHGFRLQAADLEKAITPKSKILILNYPHNPTGAIMEKADLEAIKEVVVRHDLLVVSDEIYAELTYGKKHVSFASLPEMKERTIYINGFSKAFAMTGWRLGYLAAPSRFVERLRKAHQYAMLAAPTISQYAALAALEKGEEETVKMREAYNARRLAILTALKKMGLDCFTPEGAFYVFPSIRKSGLSSDEFVSRLFKEEKLLLISGSAFGPTGEGYVRISYAYAMETIKEGMKRIQHFLSTL
jgi:aminotransferase